jgi:hypothetical protein
MHAGMHPFVLLVEQALGAGVCAWQENMQQQQQGASTYLHGKGTHIHPHSSCEAGIALDRNDIRSRSAVNKSIHGNTATAVGIWEIFSK